MNNKKKKIIFVLPDLTSGGAERVMSFVAKNISKDIFDVSLWAAGFSKNTKYNLEGVNVVYFNKERVLKAIPDFYSGLKKERPDIVISSIGHVNAIMGFLSMFFPKTKFIGREANVLSIRGQFVDKKSAFDKFPLTKISYKFLDIILCQSKDMYEDMKSNYGVPEKKLRIINNPISDSFNLKTPKETTDGVIKFITVARLKKQKGHERIIEALSKVKFPFEYTIVGDGPEKERLFQLIKDKGLEKNIIHVPYTNEVAKYLSVSDFFLQGSYVEGFPNSLIESCSVGTPVIAFNALGGLNEIIENGVNGYIAEDANEYLKCINQAVNNDIWHAEKVNLSVTKKFNKEKIIKEYQSLFVDLLRN